ncbi:MAG: ABC transporter substrate-binding protein, partial [Hyphomicrobiales bacterium]
MRRISRRSFLTGAAATAAAGTGALAIALRERDTGHGEAPPREAAIAPPTPSPAPSATPDTRPRGGIARLTAPASLSFDTFDALRAGDPAVVEVLGRTHSRLLQWTNFATLDLGPDLAASWERPDGLTLVLHLDPAARWQDRPPLNGRAVIAGDVVEHLRRALALATDAKFPALQRPEDLASVASVRSTAANTVVITTSHPAPLLLSALAN